LETAWVHNVKSDILNDFMVNALDEEFGQDVERSRKYAQTTFFFSDENHVYHVKSKKMDRRFRLAFVPTQLSLEFLAYNVQLRFDDILKPTNVFLTYRMNPLNTEIEDLYLACPVGPNSFTWIHKIEPTTGVEVEASELAPLVPSSGGRRVTPKSF